MYEDSRKILDVLSEQMLSFHSDIEKETLQSFISSIGECQLVDEGIESDESKSLIHFFDCPDFVITSEKFVVAIEHFEVDASTLTNKGSSFKRYYTEKYEDKILECMENEVDKKGFAKFSERVKTTLSYYNMIDNLMLTSDNHYLKIEKYKENIRKKFNCLDKHIYIIFFIDCKQILPTLIQDDNGEVLRISPANDIRLIEYLSDKKNLDGVIIHFDKEYKQDALNHFILCNEENLKNKSVDNTRYFDFTKTRIIDSHNPMSMRVIYKTEGE